MHDFRAVKLDGAWANTEARGNHFIARSVRERKHHLAFAWRQLRRPRYQLSFCHPRWAALTLSARGDKPATCFLISAKWLDRHMQSFWCISVMPTVILHHGGHGRIDVVDPEQAQNLIAA